MHLLVILFSLSLSIIVAILGFVPSFFVTAFNIYVFGPLGGFLLCIVGESLGAIVSFYVYRLGFKNISQKMLEKYPIINKIINSNHMDQIKLILIFRLLPYMPSGIVTYGGAISNIDIISFSIASTLGKIPSIFLEVLLTIGVLNALNSRNLNIIVLIISICLLIYLLMHIIRKGNNEK